MCSQSVVVLCSGAAGLGLQWNHSIETPYRLFCLNSVDTYLNRSWACPIQYIAFLEESEGYYVILYFPSLAAHLYYRWISLPLFLFCLFSLHRLPGPSSLRVPGQCLASFMCSIETPLSSNRSSRRELLGDSLENAKIFSFYSNAYHLHIMYINLFLYQCFIPQIW